MKTRTQSILVVSFSMVITTAVLVSCDAQKQALTLFSSQGLNLLRPARDYIKPGGMVFIQKGGTPEYDDPADPIASENGNLTDFRGTILQETSNKTTGFGAALSLAKSVLPLSLSAGAQSNRVVSLKNIDTTGVRLTTTALDDFIGKPNTSKAAVEELSPPRGTRVFVVQEVYKATSLDLEAQDKVSFDLKLNNGNPVANCDQAGTGTDSTKPAAPAAKPAAPAAPAAKPAAPAAPAALQTATQQLSAGVAFCMADSYTLKLQTKDPIPFAVRLAELELVDGKLRRIRGAKTFTGTLGGGGEISGSVVDEQTPVVAHLKHRAKKRAAVAVSD